MSRSLSRWFNRWEGVSADCFMSQSIRYCTMRQIYSNLYSCSAKLLWVFKLTVMFSNWNINLFRPLIWSPQWCITKYFIVSDLLKFYNQLLLFCTFYSKCSEWDWPSVAPGGPQGHSQGLARESPCEPKMVTALFLSFPPCLGFLPSICVLRPPRLVSSTDMWHNPGWEFACLFQAVMS